MVFPMVLADNRKVALRCWHADVSQMPERSRVISEYLTKVQLPYFVDFHYEPDGLLCSQGLQPIIIMDWAEGVPLKDYLETHLDKRSLETLARNFVEMCNNLHDNKIAHGDLQHGNILVKDNGELLLVDYDSMFVPGLEGYSDEIKGLPGYQHTARWSNPYLSEKADYFSELIIYTSIMALSVDPALWAKLQMVSTDYLLFSEEDLASKGRSEIFSLLNRSDEFRYLSEKIVEFLELPSIEQLSPLESVVTPPPTLGDAISKKWKTGNGFVQSPPVSVDIDTIMGKTKNRPKVDSTPSKPTIDDITNKW